MVFLTQQEHKHIENNIFISRVKNEHETLLFFFFQLFSIISIRHSELIDSLHVIARKGPEESIATICSDKPEREKAKQCERHDAETSRNSTLLI